MIEPYYQDNMVTIYHGDCAEIVPELGRFDLLLTDPPYGLSAIMVGGKGHGWGKFDNEYKGNEWDESAPQHLVEMCIGVCDNAVIWGGNYFSLPPSRGWIIYAKPERNFTMADAELAWTSFDRNTRIVDGPRSFPGRVHPTQKPELVMRFCLSYAGEVGSVLDPFMGSGTTLAVCRKEGIRSVGIDREEKYCEIAAQRVSQMSLFEA